LYGGQGPEKKENSKGGKGGRRKDHGWWFCTGQGPQGVPTRENLREFLKHKREGDVSEDVTALGRGEGKPPGFAGRTVGGQTTSRLSKTD